MVSDVAIFHRRRDPVVTPRRPGPWVATRGLRNIGLENGQDSSRAFKVLFTSSGTRGAYKKGTAFFERGIMDLMSCGKVHY